jgi:hypothetical protein
MCHNLPDAPQRIMSTAARSKTIRAVAKLRFPDSLQNQADPVLHNPVLKTGNPQRPPAAIPLGNVYPPSRLGPIAQAAYPTRETPKSNLQPLRVVRLPHPIHPGRLPSILALEAGTQSLQVKEQPHQ